MNEKGKRKNIKNNIWDKTSHGLALVSGLFALIITIFLIANYITGQYGLPEKETIYSEELVQKKALLAQNPNDEQLKSEIRQLDLQMRQGFFERQVFAQRGKYLLLFCVIVFVFSMKRIYSSQKRRIFKRKYSADYESTILSQGRLAIGAVGIILAAGFLSMALVPQIEFPVSSTKLAEAEDTGPAYPTEEEIEKNWPTFRGPWGLGISHHENIPTKWDSESGKGIRWKKEIKLPGNNSPLIWEDKVFISGGNEESKAIFCYALDTGEMLWQGDVNDIPGNKSDIEIFMDTGYAAPTMACDGERVYAIFADGDLVAYDFEGNRAWGKHLGVPDSIYTFATSLMMYQNLLLVQFDQGTMDDNQSVLYAFNGKTGKVEWKTPRPVANAWTSPIIIDTGEEKQIITCSEPYVMGYEPDTGKELWRAELLGTDLAPSASFGNGLVFAVQPSEIIFALRPDGRGDVTKSHLAWEKFCPAPDITSPVSNDEFLFFTNTIGELFCYDTKTGEEIWMHAFEDTFQASPILVNDWLYLVGESGNTYLAKAAKEVEIGETSFIDEWFRATPAFVDGHIILRGEENLYCIENG